MIVCGQWGWPASFKCWLDGVTNYSTHMFAQSVLTLGRKAIGLSQGLLAEYLLCVGPFVCVGPTTVCGSLCPEDLLCTELCVLSTYL